MAIKLNHNFFKNDTISVAQKLIGKILVHKTDNGLLSGRIVETEAYLQNDPACHASAGKTNRNAAMFGLPGYAYVYFTYGFHYCLNFVTQPEGIAEAVLIRSLIPIEGIETMVTNRKTHILTNLCSGPGKLTKALEIDASMDGTDLESDILYILDDVFDPGEIVSKTRVGIRLAVDKLWRFYPINHIKWISRK